MDLKLVRTHQDAYGTFGDLYVGELYLAVCEPPWREWSETGGEHHPFGVPYLSCVPTGSYDLVYHHSPKYGSRWHLSGVGVHLTNPRNGERFACLFHAGNHPGDTAGCLLPGLRHQRVMGARGVASSSIALSKLEMVLDRSKTHRINIS